MRVSWGQDSQRPYQFKVFIASCTSRGAGDVVPWNFVIGTSIDTPLARYLCRCPVPAALDILVMARTNAWEEKEQVEQQLIGDGTRVKLTR
jgi:hypothetical protein